MSTNKSQRDKYYLKKITGKRFKFGLGAAAYFLSFMGLGISLVNGIGEWIDASNLTTAKNKIESYYNFGETEKAQEEISNIENLLYKSDISYFHELSQEQQLQFIESTITHRGLAGFAMIPTAVLLYVLNKVLEEKKWKNKNELEEVIYQAYLDAKCNLKISDKRSKKAEIEMDVQEGYPENIYALYQRINNLNFADDDKDYLEKNKHTLSREEYLEWVDKYAILAYDFNYNSAMHDKENWLKSKENTWEEKCAFYESQEDFYVKLLEYKGKEITFDNIKQYYANSLEKKGFDDIIKYINHYANISSRNTDTLLFSIGYPDYLIKTYLEDLYNNISKICQDDTLSPEEENQRKNNFLCDMKPIYLQGIIEGLKYVTSVDNRFFDENLRSLSPIEPISLSRFYSNLSNEYYGDDYSTEYNRRYFELKSKTAFHTIVDDISDVNEINKSVLNCIKDLVDDLPIDYEYLEKSVKEDNALINEDNLQRYYLASIEAVQDNYKEIITELLDYFNGDKDVSVYDKYDVEKFFNVYKYYIKKQFALQGKMDLYERIKNHIENPREMVEIWQNEKNKVAEENNI